MHHYRPCLPAAAPAADNLQTRLYFGTRYYHDLSVDALLHLSVFSDISGADINIDNHKGGEDASPLALSALPPQLDHHSIATRSGTT